LAELRKDFGYAVESVKKVGAASVEAARVDIPTTGSRLGKRALRDYISDELNYEFNNPEELAATPSTHALRTESTVEYDKPYSINNKDVKTSPHGFFAASARDWRHVLRVGARASVLHLGSGIGVDPRLSAGAFAVAKSGNRLRLICDRRPRNNLERTVRKVGLPSPARFCRVLVPKSHTLRLSCRDLKDFYYNLEVDEDRWRKQSWGPRVPMSWFENLDDVSLDDVPVFDEWCEADLVAIRTGKGGGACPKNFVQPMAKTLVMGDLNAVLLAQEAHLGLLDKAGVTGPSGDLGRARSFPRGAVCGGLGWGDKCSQEVLSGVYIDDLAALALVPWSALGSLPSKAELLCRKADATYESEGWPRSTAKDQCDEACGKTWGVTVEGNRGTVGIARDKRLQLAAVTL
jgi:hypothetical protein